MTQAPKFPHHPEPSGIDLPEPPDQPVVLTVHLSLDDTEPQVWRRLTIPGGLDLEAVHDVVQVAMGWTNSHMHRFQLGKGRQRQFFLTGWDLDEGEEGVAETDARLDQVLRARGNTLRYTYDFGDSWDHTLRLESSAAVTPTTGASDTASASASPPICLAGAGACPPEDVGGIPGYEEMAEWARDGYGSAHAPQGRDAEDLAELRAWLSADWHPDEFSVEETSRNLARLATGDGAAASAQRPEQL